jgi:ATP synthase subunit 6
LNIINQQIGRAGFLFFPLVLGFFLILLFCNLLSLTPFSLAITSHINIIAYLTFSLNLAVFLKGFMTNQLNFLKIFVPSSPLLLLFLLIPIEIFSYAIRSLSMCIRLAANIIAGHTLVFIVSSFLLIF